MRFAACLVVGLAFGCAGSAPPPVSELPPPSNEREAEQRLRFLESRLDAGRRHAQLWHWGWTAANGGSIAMNAASMALDDDAGSRTYSGLQIGISTFGLVDLLVRDPVPGRAGADPIREGDPATRLAHGEALLAAAAEHAEGRRAWPAHLANAAIQTAAAAVLLGIDEPGYAAVSFGLGMLGGEAMLWSAPYQPARDWRSYREMVTRGALPAEPKAEFRFTPTAQGLAFELRY